MTPVALASISAGNAVALQPVVHFGGTHRANSAVLTTAALDLWRFSLSRDYDPFVSSALRSSLLESTLETCLLVGHQPNAPSAWTFKRHSNSWSCCFMESSTKELCGGSKMTRTRR